MKRNQSPWVPACVVALVVFTRLASADSMTWTNQVGGSWSVAENWSPNQVPGAADSATIPGGLEITISGTASINGLSLGNGSTLSIEPGAVLNLTGSDSKVFYGPVRNRGTLRWLDGQLTVYGTAGNYAGEIWNEAGGVIDIQCNQALASNWGNPPAPIHNAGTLRKTGGTGGTDCTLSIDNTGLVQCSSGTLRFLSGGTLKGILEAAADCSLQFAGGNLVVSGPQDWRGPGEVKVLSSSVTLDMASGTLDLKDTAVTGNSRMVGGTLNLSGCYLSGNFHASGGTINWAGGGTANGAALTIDTDAVLNLTGDASRSLQGPVTNRGTINWLGGAIAVYGTPGNYSGEIWNEVNGVIDIQCDQALTSTWGNPAAPLNNLGLLRKTSGTGATDITLATRNSGTIEILHGMIRFGLEPALAGGHVVVSLAGPTDFGRLGITGTPTLAGSLTVQLAGGFVPSTGTSYPVVASSGGSGAFDAIHLPDAVIWQTTSSPGSVTLGVENVRPVITIVPDQTLVVGRILDLAILARDADQPSQTLSYSLEGGPTGATLDPATGKLGWRARVSDAGKQVTFTVRVADDAPSPASATTSFLVSVPALAEVRLTAIGLTNGVFTLELTGDAGPTYEIEVGDELGRWESLTTVSPALMPATIPDPAASQKLMRYYRAKVGPE